MADAKRDQNNVPTLLGVSNVDGVTPVVIWADPVTHRLLVDASGGGSSIELQTDGVPNGDQTLLNLIAGTNITLTDDGVGGVTIDATGGGGMAIGDPVTGGTSGSVLFVDSSGDLAQDNANLFWDNANNRLGVGTNSPSVDRIHVSGNVAATGNFYSGTDSAGGGTDVGFISRMNVLEGLVGGGFYNTNAAGYEGFNFYNNSSTLVTSLAHSNGSASFLPSSTWFGTRNSEPLHMVTNTSVRATILSGGNFGIGTQSPSQPLHVAGNVRVTGAFYDSTNSPGTSGQVLSSTATGTDWIDGSAIPTGFTTGSVIFQGSSGSFAQDNANFFWDDTNNRLGIGTATPSAPLDVYGGQDLVSIGRNSGTDDTDNNQLTLRTRSYVGNNVIRSLDRNGAAGFQLFDTGKMSVCYYGSLPAGFALGVANGAIDITGVTAGFQVSDRTNNANKWQHYSTSDIFRIYKNFGTGTLEPFAITSSGAVGINTLAPSAKTHIISTTEQLRLGYDTSNYFSTTVGSAGGVTFNAVGASSLFTFSDNVIVTTAGTASGSVLTNDGTQTVTNKRIQPRSSTAATGDITPALATANVWQRTALSAGITINAPTGTPVLGETLVFMLLDNGTSRSLTWNSAFTTRPMSAALPTATTISKQLLVTCQYNGTTWLCLSSQET